MARNLCACLTCDNSDFSGFQLAICDFQLSIPASEPCRFTYNQRPGSSRWRPLSRRGPQNVRNESGAWNARNTASSSVAPALNCSRSFLPSSGVTGKVWVTLRQRSMEKFPETCSGRARRLAARGVPPWGSFRAARTRPRRAGVLRLCAKFTHGCVYLLRIYLLTPVAFGYNYIVNTMYWRSIRPFDVLIEYGV